MTTSTITQAQAELVSNVLKDLEGFSELTVSPVTPDEDGKIVDGDLDTFDFHFNTAVGTWDAGVALVSAAIVMTFAKPLNEMLDLVATLEHNPTASGMVVKVPASL